ncbi:hypothetical protein [Petrimonas sp.]|uniref:fimbrial tip adhesin FimD n=1 Tax=Petrimonas sp. TaxID=2023866 RepID=UPI003F5119A3
MKQFIYIFLLGSVFFFASCIEENLTDCNKLGNHQFLLKLVVTSNQPAATRSAGYGVTRATEPGDDDYYYPGLVDNLGNPIQPYNENKINRVDIFFYQGETQIWHPQDVSVSYDANNTPKAIISIPIVRESLFDGTESYDIYIVVNGPSSASMTGLTLPELREMAITTPFHTTNRINPVNELVMDGSILNKRISLDSPDLGTVDMRRAAAKIRVRIIKGPAIDELLDYNGNGIADHDEGIDGTTGATPLVSVKNYNEQGALLQGGAIKSGLTSDLDYRVANLLRPGKPNFIGITTPYPIYSYANDWSDWSQSGNKDDETYLLLRVPLYVGPKTPGMAPPPTSEFTYFYYRIPVNFQRPDGPQDENEKKFYRLDRNHLYDIQVVINQLGGTQDNPLPVSGNYVIKDWTTSEVDVSITAQHYLVADPLNSRVNNKDHTVLSYSSSKLPITVSNIRASYTFTNTSGNPETQYYPNGAVATGTPTVASDRSVRVYIDYPSSGKITVTSAIPGNNVPKDISFTISNGISTLNQTVTIQQLPANYITNYTGTNSSQPGTTLPNHALYIATSSIPSGIARIGFPPIDPTTGYTVASYEVNNLVSPSFMLASQLGATFPMDFGSAQSQCANYWEETEINGQTVRYEDFRLPTAAEIALIDQLQNTPTSAVKAIMTGKWYWDAKGDDGAYEMKGGTGGTQYNAHTRCVRDVKN